MFPLFELSSVSGQQCFEASDAPVIWHDSESTRDVGHMRNGFLQQAPLDASKFGVRCFVRSLVLFEIHGTYESSPPFAETCLPHDCQLHIGSYCICCGRGISLLVSARLEKGAMPALPAPDVSPTVLANARGAASKLRKSISTKRHVAGNQAAFKLTPTLFWRFSSSWTSYPPNRRACRGRRSMTERSRRTRPLRYSRCPARRS
jgi:hypothetical protein